MRPGPDGFQRPPILHQTDGPATGDVQVWTPASLSDAQRRLISVLQGQQRGMTVRQLQTRLSWPRDGLEQMLDTLRERQLVARLNTIVPSYIYRYGGVDLDSD